MSDETFMLLAIEQARLGDIMPGAGEVGCVIVSDGRVVAAGHNEAEMRHDPTAHAEIVTIRRLASETKSMDLSGHVLYLCDFTTLQHVRGRLHMGKD